MKLEKLKTNFLGRNFKFYKEIDSTQNEIYRLIESKTIKNGTLIMADIQTNGIGTHGRKWYTDTKGNIAFSFYIDTNCNIKKLEGLTIEIAKIIVNIFEKKYNIKLDIKEPNDIVCNGFKIGGILTESRISGENLKNLIIGIGINTNKMNFTNDIKRIATSIKKEYNIKVDNLEIITEFCNEFEEILKRRKVK
jgi:BirA family biotin operon repressor/biotin-[acetyl-CoA-carboxylase] ligase